MASQVYSQTKMSGRVRHDAADPLVLVVDDDSRIRSYIKAILQDVGVQVLEAGDGVEALEVFHACHGRIALVITDIQMPRMTGTDLAILLRSDCPAIPLIFVSGEPAPMILVEGRVVDIRMADLKRRVLYIAKPFAPKILLDAARRFLN